MKSHYRYLCATITLEPAKAGKTIFFFNEYDLPYEEELLRNPFSLHSWLKYIDYKRNGSFEELCSVFERAIQELPRSYKLWKQYLDIRREKLKGLNAVKQQDQYNDVVSLYERSLVLLHKMPRIWLDYLSLLTTLPIITKTRRAFDEALRALPVTQHNRIWELYLQFAKAASGQTAITIYKRYLKLEPSFIEKYIENLIKLEQYDEAAVQMVYIFNDNKFKSTRGKSNYQLWQDLCELAWQQLALLWGNNKEKVVETYTQAVQIIHPKKAHGKLQDLWAKFAKFYEDGDDLDSARAIFEKAVKTNYKSVSDLADIWCEYAEMETRHDDFDRAIDIMARATQTPKFLDVNPKQVNFHDESIPVQHRLFKSLRLWSFYIDLEESVGTVESTKAVYDKVMDLRIANPQTIVNYATFLEENQYFEESYKVYERGIELFGWPIAFELWNIYLERFLKRYGGTKLERARDLFEQALDQCPPKYAKSIYLMYGKLEEEHGLARHAMRVYDRATKAVADEDRREMYEYYIAKATESFGVMASREIYESAIESLPDKDVRIMALRYAALEQKLGEIERARAIYGFAAQMFDPRKHADFWKTWHDFEVHHGNEDTFKEMLRIKRSVQATFT
ncbi:hypothetical protein RO3G_07390 [Rhizopus delemar RA 99-880]|uniref:Pre-mRNA-splicing factor SYF1 n=1 Tax=Rhizopus delemar (strain RA 99-880 / ATCC MYA-4621 / FGSC 9543 / NRRL 43880) TaxID=246409 RepID=I1C2K5_RHIO9|nr:hypothetical protein RO3G_07390 [Rhizopus delemar RA 99-880]|eukprot:EIE82685.1 hypothetical protein RO3G_07390 [Rhizopus delemar RA 99-880]